MRGVARRRLARGRLCGRRHLRHAACSPSPGGPRHRPAHRARPAALDVRQGRDRAAADHLRGLPDPGRRDQADLGRRHRGWCPSRTRCPATSRSAALRLPGATTCCSSPSRCVTGLSSLSWALYCTRQGKLLLAVIHDREISAAMGINVDRVYLVTFTIGAMLAALGGALTAPIDRGEPGHRRRGDRALVRGGGDRRPRQPRRRGARRAAGRRSCARPRCATGPKVELFIDLRRDGAGADRAAEGPVRPPEARKI